MPSLIPKVTPTQSLVDAQGKARPQFRTFLLNVANSATIVGSGIPEGSLVAKQGILYVDIAGAAGAILYVKQLQDVGGDTSKGWVAI